MAVEDRLLAILSRASRATSDFDLNPGLRPPEGTPLRDAAVLVPVWLRPGGPRVILTRRSSHLQHHPGQVALPGGKVDAGDASAAATALREAQEEIGLPPGLVSILGPLPVHRTVTGFSVTPLVALVRGDFVPRPEAGEVDEIFTVPLDHVLTAANHAIEQRLWHGEWRRYHVVPWGPYYIWGATARILRGMADR